jgi:hypothetical protein
VLITHRAVEAALCHVLARGLEENAAELWSTSLCATSGCDDDRASAAVMTLAAPYLIRIDRVPEHPAAAHAQLRGRCHFRRGGVRGASGDRYPGSGRVSASPGWICPVTKTHRDVVALLSCTSTALVVRKRMPSIRHLRTMAYPRVLTLPFVHLAACGANERNSYRREAAQYNPLGFQSRRNRCECVWAPNQYVAYDELPPGDHSERAELRGPIGWRRAAWWRLWRLGAKRRTESSIFLRLWATQCH